VTFLFFCFLFELLLLLLLLLLGRSRLACKCRDRKFCLVTGLRQKKQYRNFTPAARQTECEHNRCCPCLAVSGTSKKAVCVILYIR
jgi:hypothetical protein